MNSKQRRRVARAWARKNPISASISKDLYPGTSWWWRYRQHRMLMAWWRSNNPPSPQEYTAAVFAWPTGPTSRSVKGSIPVKMEVL